jgi:Cell division protein FtsI/penicillin-binding protein 2
MKNMLRNNIRILLFVFTFMFAGLITYLAYAETTYGEHWFASPYNPRIQNLKADILDRTGLNLVHTEDGETAYVDDKGMRRAIAHVVGDEYGYSYGAQTMYSTYLYGFDKDTIGKIQDLISGGDTTGSDVTLTIDAALCKTALSAMGDNKGAVVVMNYKTGEILASVSSPTFDPSDMEEFMEGGGESELVNRAFSGLYPPGSIFKLVTASALIENGLDGFETECDGSTVISGNKIVCTGEHGSVGLEKAVAKSCNVYFAEAAQELGANSLTSMAGRFLFNDDMRFGDLVMAESVYDKPAGSVDTAWSSIGQYHDLITPLHACMLAGCIANDGVMMEPKLLLSVSGGASAGYTLSSRVAARPIESATAEALTGMMIACVESGTGKKAALSGYTVAGKTGTAEIAGEAGNASHAWFVGFIDDEDHPLCIAVLLERAGSGGSHAAPVAHDVLERALKLGY